MDTILIAVTAVALAMTATMAVIIVTVLRQERARSEARVAALSAMAADATDDRHVLVHQEATRPEPLQPELSRREVAAPRLTATPRPIEPLTETTVVDDIDDFEIHPGVSGVANLFSEPEQSSPWGRRFVVIGCLAALLMVVGLAMVVSRSQAAPATSDTAAAQTAPATDGSPLELLSLRYAQESGRLVITGLVQNPRGATPLSHVVATAFVFGPGGTFLSSGRAPLDFVTLTPGEESPFVVNVPVTGQVTRYRVGFRTEDGRVLPHVDKRAAESLAQK
jgi:hypothetical protein